ncbi:POU domain class 2-associating factor 1 [Solea solea]|uniref:POU domain class 2-associating factor 1 n=1 Tax=Solea solea TaxID=90069 RepID=UPI00272A6E6D|nr:POU domain class 2-associating factor 1 [Solea solea]
MHWEKTPPSTLARSRPYQGVRVRDPVKELLRRKRSLELHSTKTAPSLDEVQRNNQSTSAQAIFGSGAAGSTTAELPAAAEDGPQQCTGWKTPSTATGAAMTTWSSHEYCQQEPSAQTLAYPATSLTADLYMQTLCPSYTMLTYTHTPLLTNFGTIPVAPAPASLPQMELQDSGLTYLPWAQPLTTISTVPTAGVQFAPGTAAALSTPPLMQMPLSMSLTTMIPQLEPHGPDLHPHILDLPQRSELDEDAGIEPGSPNLLDKLLEDQKEDGEEESKDSYSSSLFIPNV